MAGWATTGFTMESSVSRTLTTSSRRRLARGSGPHIPRVHKDDYENFLDKGSAGDFARSLGENQLPYMVHACGAEVIVDGAHSFGLLDFKIPDSIAIIFGTSLHKFLSAPIGSSMMWIKKDTIEKTWSLTAMEVLIVKIFASLKH